MTLGLADQAAVAHQASWVQTHKRWGRGWLEVRSGFTASFSGLPVPSFNGVSVYGPCDPDDLDAALSRVAAADMPYSLQCRPDVLDMVGQVAAGRGMQAAIGAPLMICTTVPQLATPPGLAIRALAPEENHVHAAILADAFGTPLEMSVELAPELMLAPANVWTLVGEYDGTAVCTGLLDLQAGVGNIHNVGTLSSHRGRGFGTALTAATVRLAVDSGAQFTMLLSSQMAIGVYERIGFAEIEHWSAWQSPPIGH